MPKLSYAEQLKHPFWQRKRLEILERDGWECVSCSAKEKTLHVHHKRYVKGLLAWQHDSEDLASYCEGCHAADHETRALLDEMLARSTTGGTLKSVTAIVGGFLTATYSIDREIAERARDLEFKDFEAGSFLAVTGFADWLELAAFVRAVYTRAGATIDPAMAAAIERWEYIDRRGFKG